MVSGATDAMNKTNPDRLIPMISRGSLASEMLLHWRSRRSLSSEMLLHWRWIAVAALVTGTIWLWSSFVVLLGTYMVQVLVLTKALLKDFFVVNELWRTADSNGWRASSAPRTYWPPPSTESESNGYLRVRCNGGFTQQRSAICNSVVVARIMNATLVLPELGTNSFLHDESGFVDIYDVPHFIKTLKYDVRIVTSIPKITEQGKNKKLRAYKIEPPEYAPVTWYRTTALETMRKYGVIYLTPFSHRLAEEIDDPELQRLRCRVNYHALQFKPNIMETSTDIMHKLRSEGHFMSIHLRFELEMLALYGCIDIFTPKEQEILLKYQEEHIIGVAVYPKLERLTGNCPLTPEEVGLTIRAMGFDNTTRIYLASGELFGGKRLVKPLKAMFPRLVNHTSMVGNGNKLEGLAGSAVDYMVCLLSDIFIPVPTYDDEGHSNLVNHLMGHRLYYGFRTTIIPNRKALVPIFNDMKEGHASGYEERMRQFRFNTHFGGLHKRIYPEYSFYTEGHASGYERIRQVMFNSHFGGPHKRIRPQSFYTNSWPECFCQMKARNHADRCPPNNVINHDVLESQFQNEEDRSY